MLTSGLVFRALASLLVGYIATAMRPPRASPSREIHGASRDHYAPDEALARGGAARAQRRPRAARRVRRPSRVAVKHGLRNPGHFLRAPERGIFRRGPVTAKPMKSTIAAALLVSAWSSAGSAEALAPVPSSPGSGPRWFLVGGAHQPTLFQALGAGRALVCNDRRCDVWDGAAGAWKPTGAVVLPLNTLSSLRRQDGAVVAVDGARKIASAIWSPVTGRWTAAAALPEPLNQLRTAQLSDGRIVAVGQWRTGLRAYVA